MVASDMVEGSLLYVVYVCCMLSTSVVCCLRLSLCCLRLLSVFNV